MRITGRRSVVFTLQALAAAALFVYGAVRLDAQARPPLTYTAGQSVEAREGDVWSPATVVAREGRRVQIRYEDGTEEWVTADRLRATGSGGEGPADAGDAPVATPPRGEAAGGPTDAGDQPERPKPFPFKPGQTVECKWGGSWFEAKIMNRRPEGWVLVQYTRDKTMEWVEPWRLRALGSTEDNIGHASPTGFVRDPKRDRPPSERPGPAPAPFGVTARGGARAGADEAPAAGYEEDPAYKAMSVDGAQTFDLNPPSGTPFAPDPATAKTAGGQTRVAQLRGAKSDGFNEMLVKVSRGERPQAIVQHDQSSGATKTRTLERVDLASGRSIATFDLQSDTTLLAVAPDAARFALRADGFHGGEKNRVEVWDWPANGQPKRTLIFFPYAHVEHAHRRDVEAGEFVGPDTLVTMGGDDQLAVWDLAAGKATFVADAGESRFAVSPGGKQLAVETAGAVYVVDPVAGKALARLPLDGDADAAYAFSPDGTQLAAWKDGDIRLWDLAAGRLVTRVYIPITGAYAATLPKRNVDLLGEGRMLVDDALVLDVAKGLPVWLYSGAAAGALAPDGTYWYVPSGEAMLVSAALPHPVAVTAAEGATAGDAMLLRPGARVSLQVNVSGDAQAVSDALRQKLTENGFFVEDGAPVQVVAATEAGKTETRQFQSFGAGPFGATESATVTQQVSRLSVLHAGQPVWTREAVVDAGHLVQRKEGQSLQDAINEASKPNLTIFTHAQIPPFVALPREPLGTSALTASGVGR